MKLAVAALALAGCVEGLGATEVGIGRRIGMYPGEVAAVLPPLTDLDGNLFVVTGVPDSTGTPQPGVAHSGGARGGWSQGCETGSGAVGGARGWIGAVDGRGWLWTRTALVELDVASGGCTTKLDTDPVSASDLIVHAAAPLVDHRVSGNFALAIVSTAAQPMPALVTVDLSLGLVRESTPLPGIEVLAVGADDARDEGAFLVRDGSGARILVARANEGIVATIAVAGALPAPSPMLGEIAFADDGSVVATLGKDSVAIGTRVGLAVASPGFAVHTIERDPDGVLFLVGTAQAGPQLARIASGQLAPAETWGCAVAVDQQLAAGVIVIDERSGQRTATRWLARSAHGTPSLVPTRSTSPYAVGARALLVADAPVERGGTAYSQLAVVPVGVEMQ